MSVFFNTTILSGRKIVVDDMHDIIDIEPPELVSKIVQMVIDN
jgi:hypothetical protein